MMLCEGIRQPSRQCETRNRERLVAFQNSIRTQSNQILKLGHPSQLNAIFDMETFRVNWIWQVSLHLGGYTNSFRINQDYPECQDKALTLRLQDGFMLEWRLQDICSCSPMYLRRCDCMGTGGFYAIQVMQISPEYYCSFPFQHLSQFIITHAHTGTHTHSCDDFFLLHQT